MRGTKLGMRKEHQRGDRGCSGHPYCQLSARGAMLEAGKHTWWGDLFQTTVGKEKKCKIQLKILKDEGRICYEVKNCSECTEEM